MKRICLIGHRGTGKSAFLKRISAYHAKSNSESRQDVQCLDLDREIENRLGKSLSAIFAEEGELGFRKYERALFQSLDQETSSSPNAVYLACGAGFDPAAIPDSWKVVWIRRSTDAGGRIFMDRPRLNPRVPALEEFNERYHRRQSAYAARADEVLWIEEGLEAEDSIESSYVLDQWRSLQGAITLLPVRFRTEDSLRHWIERRVHWGIRWFELRDDLLNEEQIERAIQLLPDDRVLLSFRKAESRAATELLASKHALAFDWPLEFGPCDFAEPKFLSLHERHPGQSLLEALERFPTEVGESAQLKAALPVESFDELKEGHSWWQQSAESRTFLPLSSDGRWNWYRLRQGTSVPLNFFREDDGTGPDQPTLLQWARRREIENKGANAKFAAVLGDPVVHSRSPIEHAELFSEQNASVYAIRMKLEEAQSGALEVLRQLGLKWAAVTAPIKSELFSSSQFPDQLGEKLKAANTLMWNEERGGWMASNTDLEGLSRTIETIRNERGELSQVAIWGGGGTLNVIKTVLPAAQLFALRTGENREEGGQRAEDFRPDTLVWAVGRGHGEPPDPPEVWQPRLVVDLNYTEDSPGRAFALARGCQYVSGLSMFKHQAEAQQRFWKRS